MLNKTGPTTEPCGTPYFILANVDLQPLTLVACVRPLKNDLNHSNTLGLDIQMVELLLSNETLVVGKI